MKTVVFLILRINNLKCFSSFKNFPQKVKSNPKQNHIVFFDVKFKI